MDKGKDVEKLPRKCVPFARVFGKKKIIVSFLKDLGK